jgi:hypothetical protein
MKPGLQAEILDERLVISISCADLAFAVMQRDIMDGLQVVNPDEFCRDIIAELGREEEDGSSPLHLLFDTAAERAVENGSMGIDEAPSHFPERRSVPRGMQIHRR